MPRGIMAKIHKRALKRQEGGSGGGGGVWEVLAGILGRGNWFWSVRSLRRDRSVWSVSDGFGRFWMQFGP